MDICNLELRLKSLNFIDHWSVLQHATQKPRTQYDPDMLLTGNAKLCCLGLILAIFLRSNDKVLIISV